MSIATTPLTHDDIAEFERASKRMRLQIASQCLVNSDGTLNVDLSAQAPLQTLDLWLRLARSKSADFKNWINIPKNIRPYFGLEGYVPTDPDIRPTSLIVRLAGTRMTEGDVRNLMSRFGYIRDVYIPINVMTGKPRAFAFVEIIGEAAADAAIKAFADATITVCGHRIEVDLAVNGRKTSDEMRARA
jgi:hypothetical protein